MEVVEASCFVQPTEGGKFILMPRTSTDRSLLNGFVDEKKGRIVRVRVMNRAQPKTYDQTKTFWALAALHYQTFNEGYAPTSKQLEWWYEDLLKPELFPVRPDTAREGKMKPKGWSELTKQEGIEVISKMVTLIMESNNIPEAVGGSVSDIFTWLQGEKNSLYKDPSDYHEDGTPLSLEEWAEKNRFCMCTGALGGDVCHIVSRGEGRGFEWLVNQSWNLYRALHQIHLDIQHGISWDAVFDGCQRIIVNVNGMEVPWQGAPWLKPRVERARRLFNKGREMIRDGYSQEEVIKALSYSDSEEHDVKVEKHSIVDTRSLAEMAAEEGNIPEDIF